MRAAVTTPCQHCLQVYLCVLAWQQYTTLIIHEKHSPPVHYTQSNRIPFSDCDLYVLKYLEANAGKYPAATIESIRAIHADKL